MIQSFKNLTPQVHETVFVASDADLIGDVCLEEGSSVWFKAVLRGDSGRIYIGKNSNIQDQVTIHSGKGFTVTVGDNVSVGHGAILHGCQVEDGSLIGMHATLLNGSHVGKNCIIAAGALVPEGKVIPDGSVVMGVPGKVVSRIREDQLEGNRANALKYAALAQEYRM